MERIKLNLIPSGVAPVVHVSQYDEGREFACDLFEGANVYTLDGTETLTVQVRKPDGHLVTESVTNTSDSYIVVTTTEQMCAVHGTNLANLKIEKGSIEIASLNFLMEVEKDPLENGDPSESFVDNLNTQIYNAVADQYDSNNVIFDNVPTSGHNQPYTVTSDGIKTTIDNLELDDLHDVTISGAVSGEAVVWDGSKWVNGTVSTVGSIDDLNDVDTTGKVDNSSLVYNSNDSEWQAKKLTVTLTQAEYDQLKLDGDLVEGTNYVITDGQNVSCDLGDLGDVSISGSPSGKVLYNNGVNWIDEQFTKTLNITVNTGYTINTYSGGRVGGLVGFSLSAKKTGNWTTGWHTIGVIAEKPSQTVYVPLVNATNGGAVGMAVIYDTSGNINMYTTLTGDIILGFTVNYVTT